MDTSDVVANAGKENATQQSVLNVGLTLREAREHLGISVHDVAERIKFAPKQVEALEANDFAHLPQSTFLRGFVRSYARMLQLDEVPLIAALPGAAPAEPVRPVVAKAPVVDVAFPPVPQLSRVNLQWLASAIGVALVLGLFVLLNGKEPAEKQVETVVESVPLPATDAASAVAETGNQPPAAEPAKPTDIQKGTEPKKAAEPAKAEPQKKSEPKKAAEPVKTVEVRKIPEPAKVRETVKTVPEIAAASAPAAAAKPDASLEALKRRPLHFVFDEDMWVEVIDAQGTVLLSRNVTGGSEKWIGGPGRAPYDISISNPQKVKLYYKGSEVDLSAYPATGTAHLKVK